jgi:hypothetical protein
MTRDSSAFSAMHPLIETESRLSMKPAQKLTALVAFGAACLTRPALAQQSDEDRVVSLGLDPTNPQAGQLPGGMEPSYGRAPEDEADWRFDYHGFLTAPLRVGLNARDDAGDGQSEGVLHAPPVVPDDRVTFSHTGVVPNPYAQLNFSYGNKIVTGTASIVADSASVSTAFFDPPDQLGVNDLFLEILPNLGSNVRFEIHVGAFSNRYGAMGEYSEGQYGTPLIARINGAGEHIAATFALGDWALVVEQGLQGQTNKVGVGVTPDGFNGFADQGVGSSFVTHLHGGVGYKGLALLGAHFLTAWSQDERATGPTQPDGRINILAGDLRLTLGRFGHLYAALALTDLKDARTVGRIVEILNAPGGPGVMEQYLGDPSGGNGTLTTIGGQYDLSIGRMLSYPVPFTPGPDLLVSLFGVRTAVASDDPTRDGVNKLKYGGELSYAMLPWLAASFRYDRVQPNSNDDRFSFAVLSPRVIFRTDWNSRDQVVLQYSRWLNGSLTTVRTGFPPRDDVTAIPDEHMIALSASMWW